VQRLSRFSLFLSHTPEKKRNESCKTPSMRAS
jgi:hypothetical protein